MLSGCDAQQEPVALINGYKLWAMNPHEIYIADDKDALLVGPGLQKIAIADDLIIAVCSQETFSSNGFANTRGYSILDTRKKLNMISLTEAQAHKNLSDSDVSSPTLRDVSDFFQKHQTP
jgi:hypothetical protein